MKPFTLLSIVIISVLLWSAYALTSLVIGGYFTGNTAAKIKDVAEWGDSFGAFNAFISMLGAGVVIVTLHTQQKSILAQQLDQHQQRFESRFFELLKLMRELRSDIRFHHSQRYINRCKQAGKTVDENIYEGIEAIDRALNEINFFHNLEEQSYILTKEQAGRLYNKCVVSKNEHSFSPFFRLIYTILYMIYHDKVISDSEKWRYGNILRSQLTGNELHLIAYNACSTISKDLKFYIEYFRIFKYLRNNVAMRRMAPHFEPIAFQERT